MIGIPENIKTAVTMLQERGFEARLVGGCVRDMLRGIPPHDWDIATAALPEEVITTFYDFRVIKTGLRHGTVTVIIGGEPIEITTYRIDGEYTDSRHPDSVTFSKHLEDDLSRRDFTINAIAMSLSRELFDPFSGQTDLENGLIRCVGDAKARFSEDALRILRALRFSSTLGFRLDDATRDAAKACAYLLREISAERIRDELTKLLCGKHVGDILRGYTDTLCVSMPEFSAMIGFNQRNRHHCFDVWTHTTVVVENAPCETVDRWAALLHDTGKPATFSIDKQGEGHFYGHQEKSVEIAVAILRRLRFDNKTRDDILLLIKYHDVRLSNDKKVLKRWMSKHGEVFMRRLLALKSADNLGQAESYRNRQEGLRELSVLLDKIIEERACLSLRDLAVNGDDMTALGYSGREIGEKLQMLLGAVLDERVKNERSELLSLARKQ